MRALLLPVKDLNNAKKRLVGALTSKERFALAEAMLADTIRAVRGVRYAEKIFIATNYEPVIRLAAENRWEILREQQQISESHSVDAASKLCEQRGVSGLLRLPLDLPLIQSRDIDELLTAECHAPSSSHFGNGSFARHLAEAESAHARVIVRRNPRLEMDVDDEADLRALLEHDLSGTETGRWLRTSGVESRFLPSIRAGAMSAS